MMFNVKTNTDAAVLLSPCDDFCNGYEILIGGWENTVSVIRDREGKRFTDSQVVNLHIRYWSIRSDEGYPKIFTFTLRTLLTLC